MIRFITVNNALVNVQHIVKVVDCEDGSTAIHLDSGEVLQTDSSPELDSAIMGTNHVVAIVPCKGLDAIMDDGAHQFQMPVRYLELTANGSYRPLAMRLGMEDWSEDYGFAGLAEASGKH